MLRKTELPREVIVKRRADGLAYQIRRGRLNNEKDVVQKLLDLYPIKDVKEAEEYKKDILEVLHEEEYDVCELCGSFVNIDFACSYDYYDVLCGDCRYRLEEEEDEDDDDIEY